MGENDKKSVSDERRFLKRAVSRCFKKSRLKLLLFSSFKRFLLRKISIKGRMKIEAFRS